jgi:DNA-binding IclR family transcriptional regulator
VTELKTYAGGIDGNRSLERGIEILRAFRPGVDVLGNGEIAERTGLPRSTVSRLTRTLVNSGMLDEAHDRRAYRLAASVISLGHAMRIGSPVLNAIGPLMRAESIRRKVNVGLATADRTMMVYLESIRYSPRAALRNVVAGQQVPMELTSLGRAYLAGLGQGKGSTHAAIQKTYRGRNAPFAGRGVCVYPLGRTARILRSFVAAGRSRGGRTVGY